LWGVQEGGAVVGAVARRSTVERERERERETMGAEGVDNGGNDEEIRVGWVPLVSGWIRCI
jgi:hypothetical protein